MNSHIRLTVVLAERYTCSFYERRYSSFRRPFLLRPLAEAMSMEPQRRGLLETTYHALENCMICSMLGFLLYSPLIQHEVVIRTITIASKNPLHILTMVQNIDHLSEADMDRSYHPIRRISQACLNCRCVYQTISNQACGD